MVAMPVIGICEAALTMASFLAQRIAVVTTVDRARTPVEILIRRYGLADRARVFIADTPVLALEDPSSGARDKVRQQIELAMDQHFAEAIVLGCARMADFAAELQRNYEIPVVEGIAAAVKQAEGLVSLGLSTSKRGAYAPPLAKTYTGAMAAFAPGGNRPGDL